MIHFHVKQMNSFETKHRDSSTYHFVLSNHLTLIGFYLKNEYTQINQNQIWTLFCDKRGRKIVKINFCYNTSQQLFCVLDETYIIVLILLR